jgi:hypothetical protein
VTSSRDDLAEGTTEDRKQEGLGETATGAGADDKVLVLREQGRSFAGIARALGLDGSTQANAAFNRALRRLPTEEQESVRGREMARLDALGDRVRQRTDLDEVELARRMRSLERLRRRLLTA